MPDHHRHARFDDGPVTAPPSAIDHVRAALESYQVLFQRAAYTAQLADDERLHRMLDALVLFGLVTDTQGNVTHMNVSMRDRLGQTLEEAVGHGLIPDGSGPDELQMAILASIDAGEIEPEWITAVPLADGTTITVRWTSTFIRGDLGLIRGLTSVGEELTQVDPSDERRAESIQMESMGRLAGGVAHDFNNYLMVIGGHVQLARYEPGISDDVTPHLDQIEAATERATELIRQLLAFGRQDVPEPVTISVTEELRDLAALLRPTFRSSISIDVVSSTTDDLVKFDRSRLDQIFVNLAFNSRDAMPGGGAITYAVADRDVDGDLAESLGVEPASYVVVTVTDDGSGIDPDIIDSLFERNVTTKPPGQGGGLGLSTVLGVITQSGGAITVDAERATGTEFTLYFRRDTSARAAADVHHSATTVGAEVCTA